MNIISLSREETETLIEDLQAANHEVLVATDPIDQAFKIKIDGGWRLCNQYLCAACAVSVGDDLDHCRAHQMRGDVEHEPTPKQGGLPPK